MALFPGGSRLISRQDLAGRQATKLEAIAFSTNVIELVYRRLEDFLWAGDPNSAGFAEQSLSDAWAIIDWVHRLDGIVRHCPGLPLSSPGVADLLNSTSLVENHRNAIQHPARTMNTVSPSGRSPWGYLTWARRKDPAQSFPFSNVMPVGRLGRSEISFTSRLTAAPRWPIDYVSLHSSDSQAEIGLTGQLEAATRFAHGIEAAIASSTVLNPRGILQIEPWSPTRY
jgi:hypothetical protein